ncbi:MAG: hypothetical protein CVU97_02440 [Firmicutes bacterium HGW-Firmicutes-21]|nr:MAG: hypothetical protein CVU97_02440 [Firmicutes bacterium HGW-Firmicutes-21]
MALLTTNSELFTKMLTTYSDMVYRIALHYLKNKANAEDIVQETFLKILEKQPCFENDNHQRAWFIRVAVNASKDRLRSFWYRKTVPLEELGDKSIENNSSVLEELFLLKPNDRIVLYLYYYEQYNLKEISGLLNTSINTISARLQRARRKLKLILEEGDINNEER